MSPLTPDPDESPVNKDPSPEKAVAVTMPVVLIFIAGRSLSPLISPEAIFIFVTAPAPSSAFVTAPVAIFIVVTALSASIEVVIAPFGTASAISAFAA